MSSAHDKPIPSRVAFMKHPLHPMTVVFPVAFLTATFPADIAFWLRGDVFWAEVSFWLAAAGLVTGMVAAALGLVEFMLLKEVRARLAGWTHMIMALMALSLAGANVQLRMDDPAAAVLPWGIMISGLMAMMTGIAGWIGGTLTFGHGIGTYVHAHDQKPDSGDEEPPDPAE